jgi:wyosine [tRNA(Phe)-imidazoG37] synthetase (radical SAM superfamily)
MDEAMDMDVSITAPDEAMMIPANNMSCNRKCVFCAINMRFSASAVV